MEIKYFKKSELIFSEQNIRIHSKEQIKAIKKSIKEFGFLVPIVIDNENKILAGHCRVLAVSNNFNIPCVLVDSLTESQKQAFMIADNKIYELGSTDNNLLQQILSNDKDIKEIIINVLDNVNKIDLSHLDLSLDDCYSKDTFEKKDKVCPHCGGKL